MFSTPASARSVLKAPRNPIRLLLLTTVFGAALFGQTSEISGRILDSSKGALGGAKITLTRADTGLRRTTLSSEDGYYHLSLLAAGTYDIQAEREGFQRKTRAGVVVETGVNSVVDLQLEVGTVSESVTVTESAPLLETGTSAISHVVENKTIAGMPLLDRRSAQLTRLNGFVVQAGAGAGATFAIAGGRGNNANYLIDGGSAQNLSLGVATLQFDPPVEAMQEFNVAVSNYAAELGRTGGGVIQMTTKSGTNNFHGSAYEFFRNDALNTRTFFASTKPVLRYNLFGASLGGPIRRNRTQFFFNYEGKRQTTATTQILNVPAVPETLGDFSADTYRINDPLTKSPFPNNVIPVSRLDSVGAKLAAFYPAPNVSGAPSGKANFRSNLPAQNIANDYVARIDHIFNDNNRIFGRLLAEPAHTVTASIFPTPGTDSFGVLSHNYYYNAGATWYHNFSATLINEARFNYSRRQALSISAGANTDIDQSLGLAGINQKFFPTVTVTGLQALGNTSQQQRLQTPIRSDQYADNVTLTRGSHQIKFGVEYRYSGNVDLYSPSAGGSFAFNDTATGSGLASLLLGWVNSASRLETYQLHTRADSYAGFVQDDWRVTPNLTLNLGLRYDLDQPRWETNNRQNSFDPTAINPVSGTPGAIVFSGINGVSKYANRWDKNNFGPRIGFAWKPAETWVVRGGGAILFAGAYDQATPIVANTGFSLQGNFVSPDNGLTPAFLLAGGLPAVVSPTTADLTPAFGAVAIGQKPTTSVAYFNPNRSTGYLYQANLDIQHQFRGNLLLEAGYLGTFGHHLAAPDAQSINQVQPDKLGPGNAQILRPFPQFSNVSIIAPDVGKSNYHGVNLAVEKRYSNGLLFKANYTYAKFIDNVASRNELAAFPGTGAFTNYYNQASDRGLSGNDIRHRFIWSSIYELPFGHGRRFSGGSKFLNAVAGGWSAGFIAEVRSGTPLSAIELTNNTTSFSDGVRPNVVGDPNLPGDRPLSQKLAQWFNVNAFAVPARYTFGNAGRTFGEGPGAANVDVSLLKDFSVTEKSVLQVRVEGLNVLNHANFANPDTRQGSATFGQITSLVSGNQARILQLGLHYKF
jgi:outer membrane receptor protein involved in Fe transport